VGFFHAKQSPPWSQKRDNDGCAITVAFYLSFARRQL